MRKMLCQTCEAKQFCRKAFAGHISVATVRDRSVRLTYQNYLVGLTLPFRILGDFTVEALRDFQGRYRDEQGHIMPTPGIASLLTDGADWWFRDQIADGKWNTVDEVPKLRSEAIGRWRLIGTVMSIKETVQPVCDRR